MRCRSQGKTAQETGRTAAEGKAGDGGNDVRRLCHRLSVHDRHRHCRLRERKRDDGDTAHEETGTAAKSGFAGSV